MPLPYTDESLMIVAIERLRMEVANLPLAIAANMSRAPPPPPPPLKPTAFDRPQAVLVVGPRPLPVTGEGGGKSPPPIPSKPKEDDGIGVLSKALKAFIGQFAAVLGPIGVVAAICASSASGIQLMSSAMNVFASAVAPLLLPVAYSLSVALVAVSDVIWQRLAPALEDFDKFIMKLAVPAIRGLVEAIGWVIKAFESLTKTVAGSGESGGALGGAAVGAFAGFRIGGPLGALIGGTYGAATGAPDARAGEKPSEYYGRQRAAGGTVFGAAFSTGSESINQLFKALGGGPSEESKKATNKAQLETLAELKASMGSTGGVGSIQGNWAAAQNAASNMTPFQVRVLERLDATIQALDRAARGDTPPPEASLPTPRS